MKKLKELMDFEDLFGYVSQTEQKRMNQFIKDNYPKKVQKVALEAAEEFGYTVADDIVTYDKDDLKMLASLIGVEKIEYLNDEDGIYKLTF